MHRCVFCSKPNIQYGMITTLWNVSSVSLGLVAGFRHSFGDWNVVRIVTPPFCPWHSSPGRGSPQPQDPPSQGWQTSPMSSRHPHAWLGDGALSPLVLPAGSASNNTYKWTHPSNTKGHVAGFLLLIRDPAFDAFGDTVLRNSSKPEVATYTLTTASTIQRWYNL